MSTGDLHRTAFDSLQREAGATWTDWEGWAWVADFGDPVAEHQATRTTCSLWDESPLRKWDLRGPDAVALTDALFTNDMAALEIGQVRYGALCDEQGKMVMDGTVFRLADDHCLSITSYDSDLDWFKQVASDRGLDVQIEDRTAQLPHLQVQGPNAREVLGPITEGADVSTLRYFRFVHEGVRVGGVPCWLSRTGYSGRAGIRGVLLPRRRAGAVERGAPRRGTPRPSADRPLGDRDCCGSNPACCSPTSTTSRMTPIRTRFAWTMWSSPTSRATSWVATRSARSLPGHAATADDAAHRRRPGAGVRRRGDPGWARGGDPAQPLSEPQLRHAGDRDGRDRPTTWSQDGQRVEVALGDGTVGAEVAPFPIYDTEKRRPRS